MFVRFCSIFFLLKWNSLWMFALHCLFLMLCIIIFVKHSDICLWGIIKETMKLSVWNNETITDFGIVKNKLFRFSLKLCENVEKISQINPCTLFSLLFMGKLLKFSQLPWIVCLLKKRGVKNTTIHNLLAFLVENQFLFPSCGVSDCWSWQRIFYFFYTASRISCFE